MHVYAFNKTHARAASVPAKVMQERLGHANVSITLDLYSHVVPGMQEQAAATMGASCLAA